MNIIEKSIFEYTAERKSRVASKIKEYFGEEYSDSFLPTSRPDCVKIRNTDYVLSIGQDDYFYLSHESILSPSCDNKNFYKSSRSPICNIQTLGSVLSMVKEEWGLTDKLK